VLVSEGREIMMMAGFGTQRAIPGKFYHARLLKSCAADVRRKREAAAFGKCQKG
jgi:hypothetical protein